MKDAEYSNFEHYIRDGWHLEPKRIFVFLGDYLANLASSERVNVLDVGCATGELLGYLNSRLPDSHFTGIDVFDPLLEEAQKSLPIVTFANMSGLDLPGPFEEKFDVVSAVGVIEIFDEEEATALIRGMMSCCRPGGRVLLLSPFNEYGMDLICRHRKWSKNGCGVWERGNNIYATQTIREFASVNAKVSFLPFDIGMSLPRREDPQRAWTIEALGKRHHLMNGLKLLMDLSLCVIECP